MDERRPHGHRLLAEAAGTFLLVFGIATAVALGSNPDTLSPLLVNLIVGASVATAIFFFGSISGGHFNPGVSIALAAGGRLPWREVAPHIASQCAGAIVASGIHSLIPTIAKAGYGATTYKGDSVTAFVMEFAMSAALGAVISIAVLKKLPVPLTALVVGATVTVGCFLIGPLTGNSLNAARSLGPAIFAGGLPMQQLPFYITSTILGLVVGLGIPLYLAEKAKKNGLPQEGKAV